MYGNELNGSITLGFEALRDGDPDGALVLWERYSQQLVRLAKRRISSRIRRAADEEDVVQSVFDTLARGAQSGRFPNIKSRDELLGLLIVLTKQKASDMARRELCQKRGAGKVICDCDLPSASYETKTLRLVDVISQEPTPEFLESLSEQHDYLMSLLQNDVFRRIATATLEGYTPKDLAHQLNMSCRTIQRKLAIVQDTWVRAVQGHADA